jgi:hypothetical protein
VTVFRESVLTNSESIDWRDIQGTLIHHFTLLDRQATIRDLRTLPNFFEGWFTGECLLAVHRRFPQASLISNTNYTSFVKPDIIVLSGSFVCVIANKHIPTLSKEARSRWDGGKASTVAKDISSLRDNMQPNVVKRALVFYGPAQRVNHRSGESCTFHREFCLECNINHLRGTLADRMPEPECIELLEDGRNSFYLLVFPIQDVLRAKDAG